uniref:Uncharacterized protein n=1 Tax=Monopterus albus TaxID=43700 RepID=A0A3Q3JLT0_MONAL
LILLLLAILILALSLVTDPPPPLLSVLVERAASLQLHSTEREREERGECSLSLKSPVCLFFSLQYCYLPSCPAFSSQHSFSAVGTGVIGLARLFPAAQPGFTGLTLSCCVHSSDELACLCFHLQMKVIWLTVKHNNNLLNICWLLH